MDKVLQLEIAELTAAGLWPIGEGEVSARQFVVLQMTDRAAAKRLMEERGLRRVGRGWEGPFWREVEREDIRIRRRAGEIDETFTVWRIGKGGRPDATNRENIRVAVNRFGFDGDVRELLRRCNDPAVGYKVSRLFLARELERLGLT